ncbi:MAG: class I SAM-dependent methyltransferase [Acidobacteria bacterium]|nr:MAG: class I SAM-dependent methyltransferase [Acidobacteriota bacterium]
MPQIDSIQRFSSRVGNYVRFRPSYPNQIIHILEQECGLTHESVIADIASGTGIFSRLLLEHGNRVFGIEPNTEMRRAGEEFLRGYPKFTSVNGTAEATTLPNESMDFVTAAQAAHWFNRDRSMPEFQRILRPGGYLVLIWNDRKMAGSRFNEEYERLVETYGTDYTEVKRLGRVVEGSEFFREFECQKRTVANYQDLDYSAVEGRLLSSSYAPQHDEPSCALMLADLRRIFDQCQRNGLVRMDYDTNIYFGKLSRARSLR